MTSSLPTTAPERPAPRTAARRGPLHVAIVDEELPYPPTSGKRIRTLSLLTRLAARHRLTYISHRNASLEEAREAADYLRRLGIESVVVDRPVPRKSGPRFYARLAANLFTALPYTVATHDSPQLRAALQAHQASRRVDLWHCEWTPYAHALRAVAGRRVVVAHNVESTIWQRYHETATNPLRRWYIGRQWRKFQHFERAALGAVERAIAVSDLDADRLRQDFDVPRVAVVENGVDTGYFQPTDSPRAPAELLFLGSLDWRPNLDGARLLLDRILPAVRAAVPNAKLSLVGRQPPDWLRRAARETPGVSLHADVPDVRPYLARCALMVVPLRVGGGSRLKILEALAAGTPVVSTAVGAEGLHLRAGEHLTIVQDIEGLAAAIVTDLHDAARVRRQALAGRATVVDRYDWDSLADRLEDVWHASAATPIVSRG